MEIQRTNLSNNKSGTLLFPLLSFISLGLFFLLAYLIQTKVLWLDEWLSDFSKTHITGGLYETIAFITNLGSKPVVITIGILTLLIMWWKTRDYIGMVTVAFVLIGSDQLYKILKAIYERERPIYEPSIDAIGYSFPSGHATVSMAFYGIIFYFVWKYMKASNVKSMALIGISFYIFLIGISRVLLRAHYISDVLAGFAVAFTYLMIWIYLYNFASKLFTVRSQKDITM